MSIYHHSFNVEKYSTLPELKLESFFCQLERTNALNPKIGIV